MVFTADGQRTGGLVSTLIALDGDEASVTVLGDRGGAIGAVLAAHSALDGISGRSVMTYQQGDNSGAVGASGAA